MKITTENIEAWLLDLSEGKLTPAQQEQVRLFLHKHPELGLSVDGLDENPSIAPLDSEENNWDELKKTAWPRLEKEREDFLIGKLENSLTPQEEKELNDRLLNDDALAHEWETYRLLKLKSNDQDVSNLKTFLHFSNPILSENNYSDFFIVASETGDTGMLVQVEAFLAQRPLARAEWEMVQQLKLSPALNEKMPFKQSLKKRETKVALLYNWRFYASTAAAAVLILFIGLNWFGSKNNQEIADRTSVNKNSAVGNTQDSVQPNLPAPSAVSNGIANHYRINHNSNLANENNNKNESPLPDNPLIQKEDNNLANTPQDIKKDSTSHNKKEESNPAITSIAFYSDTVAPASNQLGYTEENTNFVTMKNVVSRVSNGFVEVDRKKNDGSKEFFLRIGNMKFHRKKKLIEE